MSTANLASAIFGTWFDASANAAFAVDRATQRVACANARFAAILGRKRGELVGASFPALLRDSAEVRDLLKSSAPREHVAFHHGGGGTAYLSLELASMAHLGRGELVAFLGRDTTAVRRLELDCAASHSQLYVAHGDLALLIDELAAARRQLEERNHELSVLTGQVSRFGWRATVGELVASLAHHLNNPLGALDSTLRRLDDHLGDIADPQVRAPLARLVTRSRELTGRLERNVNAVVRAHEASTADPAIPWLVLHRELEKALSMFADRLERVKVVRDYGDEPPVLVPHDALHLVMSNLIDNSLRAMDGSGTLMISVRQRSDGPHRARGSAGLGVCIRVSDSGRGLPAELLPHLFDTNLPVRPGGAGLGLAIAQRLARAWGGDLVHLPSTSGCTFELRIPAPPADEQARDAAGPATRAPSFPSALSALPSAAPSPSPATPSTVASLVFAPRAFSRDLAAPPRAATKDPP